MSGSNNHLTKFFLIISGFLIAVSILAVYSTTVATEYGAKKDDMQIMSMTHFLKSADWLNDYELQKLGEKVLQAQINTLNITLQNNNNISTTIAAHKQPVYYSLTKYKSYIDMLHADRSVDGSLANLKYNAEIENSTYEKSLASISETSKFISIYELATILLIIGAGLSGTSEITKNKVIGYPGFAVGTFGAIILLLVIFVPSTVVGSQAPNH